ncbi:hypothetical protein B0H16DRAFT_1837622 [Mycena metata]|uniref:Uncharacterized protein n=1 Tax=Mycena metata TaxID=1033252 RepID=A0AAD7GK29_9AGAR|nr:hypothetical protein B0H16DRAFT_1837622 [Mycena metata]
MSRTQVHFWLSQGGCGVLALKNGDLSGSTSRLHGFKYAYPRVLDPGEFEFLVAEALRPLPDKQSPPRTRKASRYSGFISWGLFRLLTWQMCQKQQKTTKTRAAILCTVAHCPVFSATVSGGLPSTPLHPGPAHANSFWDRLNTFTPQCRTFRFVFTLLGFGPVSPSFTWNCHLSCPLVSWGHFRPPAAHVLARFRTASCFHTTCIFQLYLEYPHIMSAVPLGTFLSLGDICVSSFSHRSGAITHRWPKLPSHRVVCVGRPFWEIIAFLKIQASIFHVYLELPLTMSTGLLETFLPTGGTCVSSFSHRLVHPRHPAVFGNYSILRNVGHYPSLLAKITISPCQAVPLEHFYILASHFPGCFHTTR